MKSGAGLVTTVSHNFPNNISRKSEPTKLTGVGESFCKYNFYILHIKYKKDRIITKIGMNEFT